MKVVVKKLTNCRKRLSVACTETFHFIFQKSTQRIHTRFTATINFYGITLGPVDSSSLIGAHSSLIVAKRNHIRLVPRKILLAHAWSRGPLD